MPGSPDATSRGSDLIGLMYGGLSTKTFKSALGYSNEKPQQTTTVLNHYFPPIKCAELTMITPYRRAGIGKKNGNASTMLRIIHDVNKVQLCLLTRASLFYTSIIVNSRLHLPLSIAGVAGVTHYTQLTNFNSLFVLSHSPYYFANTLCLDASDTEEIILRNQYC